MRVLVTGAGGQLGHDLVRVFEARGDHDVHGFTHAELDVSSGEHVRDTVAAVRPDAVVHAAAWTAVDACEGDPDHAYRVNALGTRHIADAARRVDASVCYVSTDYVFDGTKPAPYVEWDTPCPVSVYGRSKLGGEDELGPESTIVRTSWVCGAEGPNMVKTILRLADEHDRLSFVDDQRGHPTFTADLALMIHRLVTDEMPGVYHVTNQGAVSWYEFAQSVLTAAGLDPARVDPVATADLLPARPAPRPANSVLDNAALRLAGIDLLPDFHDALGRLLVDLG